VKILFAIQGTGNGHLSRARDVYPELAKHGEVDVLISGIQADVDVPFPVKYKLYGMSFIFGKKGGVDILQTAQKLKLFKLIKDIRTLPVEKYDLIINDFEAVSAWACKMKKIPCISLSHQCAVLNNNAPQPKETDWMGKTVLKYYAPVTDAYGFHFKAYAENIFTPVIRQEVRDLNPSNEGHYTVYLPAYDDDTIVSNLSKFDGVKWEVFSKHNKEPFTFKNVQIQPIENKAFMRSMEKCAGVLCGAGFEGPAEAMYLGKKVMVIPMLQQYEQQCNAVAAVTMGAHFIKQLNVKYHNDIHKWIALEQPGKIDFPNQIREIVTLIINKYAPSFSKDPQPAMVAVHQA